MARSLNRVQLIGNLTRDPELRYTPSGTAVCSFGLATNRSWNTDSGEKHEETEFHRIVAWNKLAELCSQFLVKGRKVYVEGRLQTRSWTGQDNQQRSTTEIVIDDMILLDSQGRTGASSAASSEKEESKGTEGAKEAKRSRTKKAEEKEAEEESTPASNAATPEEEVSPDDIPF